MHTFSTEGFGCSRQEDGVELVRGSSGLPGLVINRGTVDGKLVTFKIRRCADQNLVKAKPASISRRNSLNSAIISPRTLA